MKILGIETSCDETAVSIIEAEGDFGADFSFNVLGNALLSQAEKHAEFGGVYPSLAKREHAKNLVPILSEALREAKELHPSSEPSVSKEKIGDIKDMLEREPELFALLGIFLAVHKKPNVDAIAVTHGPGLEPALWVGVNFARALSLAWDIPIVAVNHMEGHTIISAIEQNGFQHLSFPALALLISGGHTELILMREWMQYEKIGETKDDAIGEAFDKTARLLGLPYPGGPALSALAKEAREESLLESYTLPRPMIGSKDLNFSFSGIKTAVRNLLQDIGETSDTEKKQVARAFEDAITDVFVSKVRDALSSYDIKTLIVGGGVSANLYIREKLTELVQDEFSEVAILLPPPENATDNALMIALAGYFHAKRGEFTDPKTLSAHGTLSLA